jgi:hypothetical protein
MAASGIVTRPGALPEITGDGIYVSLLNQLIQGGRAGSVQPQCRKVEVPVQWFTGMEA